MMSPVRRHATSLLGAVILAVLGFAVYYGFFSELEPGWRRETQVLYAATMLLPPALFLVLALVLRLRRAPSTNVLGLVAIAVVVGAPTFIFFLGGSWGIAAIAALLIPLGALTLSRHQASESTFERSRGSVQSLR